MTASLSAANSNLPSPASDLSTLISASSNKGFSATEMVALSGLVFGCGSVATNPHSMRLLVHMSIEGEIVEAGGLTSLLMLLRNSEDETIHGVAAGAIANLAMNGKFPLILDNL
ncbi:hypothetical protein U1Q18_032620 [Sarracenia purpurea var. burkii]